MPMLYHLGAVWIVVWYLLLHFYSKVNTLIYIFRFGECLPVKNNNMMLPFKHYPCMPYFPKNVTHHNFFWLNSFFHAFPLRSIHWQYCHATKNPVLYQFSQKRRENDNPTITHFPKIRKRQWLVKYSPDKEKNVVFLKADDETHTQTINTLVR